MVANPICYLSCDFLEGANSRIRPFEKIIFTN